MRSVSLAIAAFAFMPAAAAAQGSPPLKPDLTPTIKVYPAPPVVKEQPPVAAPQASCPCFTIVNTPIYEQGRLVYYSTRQATGTSSPRCCR